MSINSVFVSGHLGQAPELRYTQNGDPVANFSVATNESWVDKSREKRDKTEWHRIVVWGKLAENCEMYLQKGSKIFVEGKMQSREYQNKKGEKIRTTEIVARKVTFLDSKEAS